MKLKSVLDSIDGLDEALKPLYVEQNGKFILQVEGLAEHPDATALKNALDREREDRKKAVIERDDLRNKYGNLPDDFTIDEYNRLKDGANGSIDQRLAEQRARLEAQFTKERDTIAAERDKYKSAAEGGEMERAINEALDAAKIAPQFRPAVKALFRDKIKIDYEADKVITTIDSLPVQDALKSWASTSDGQIYVAAPENTGGGANPHNNYAASGKNPWAKETLNVTEQMKIQKSDPAKAEMLRKAAGK